MYEYQWVKRKEQTLKKYRYFKELGEVDKPIIPLLDLINSHPNYFTTSSCAGRIILLKVPESGKKKDAEFLFKKHEKVNVEEIWKVLLEKCPKLKEKIWFKMEPVIIHVSCRTIEDADKIIDIARRAGWKRSGAFLLRENIMVELHSTEKIETIVCKDGKILINLEYLRILVEEANKKLEITRKKMEKFYNLFKDTMFQ